MKSKNKIGLLLLGYLYILFAIGCSTKKNTPGTRAYHELTTRYNTYFNAEEAYLEIVKEKEENFQEDYAELLPFYPSPPDEEKTVPGGPFDPIIEKTGKAIQEHSITAKPRRDPSRSHSQEYRQWLQQEEFNPFLKKVWMLRGKAYLQNGDYDEAVSVFSRMLNLYGHDAGLTDEIEIWMLRTYTEMGRTYEAEKIAYSLQSKRLPKQLEKLFTEHYTYLLLYKKYFTEAIPLLQKTIAQEPDYSRKGRFQFLLGQLHAINGENDKAYRAFEKVKGIRTPFPITLNATVWQSALASGEQQQDAVRRLKKMEKKVNHGDSATFVDQRYRIYMKMGNDSLAAVFRPSPPENDTIPAATMTAAITDSTGVAGSSLLTDSISLTDSTAGNDRRIENTPLRFSQGRSLAENAALRRQWRFQNGLWQTDAAGVTAMGDEQAVPFNPDKSGPHYLLLTFTPGTADKNRLLFTTADFNFSHFKLRSFNFSYIHLQRVEALQIEPFRSFEEASQYAGIMLSDSLFRSAAAGITPIIISEENLALIRSGKKMDDYTASYTEKIVPLETLPVVIPEENAITEKEKSPVLPEAVQSEEQEVTQNQSERGAATAQPMPDRLKQTTILNRPDSSQSEQKTAPDQPVEQETSEALKRKLEENAAKASQQKQETMPRKSREQLLKERKRQREESLRQREKELKERQRKREAELKQRERERARKIRK